MDEEWKEAVDDALKQIEAIGFFAAMGMHFAAHTPLLSEYVGDQVKGTPWERFSPTEQCLERIHQLAIGAWHNLEGIATSVGPEIGDDGELRGDKRDLAKEILEPEESEAVTKLPPQFPTSGGEIRHLKTMGQTIGDLAGEGKQASAFSHLQVRSLDEIIANVATNIDENLQEHKGKISKETSGE